MGVTVALARAVRLADASWPTPGVDGNDNSVDEAVQERLLISLLLHAHSDQQSSKIVKIEKPDPINKALDVPANRITSIIKGQRSITGETAVRLATCFNTTAELWRACQ